MNDFVMRLRKRESPAWAVLYDRHVREIYGFVFHLVGHNAAVAEDVTQETWLQAVRGIEQFNAATDQVRAWLFVIARSQVALHFRRRRVAAVASGTDIGSSESATTVREPIDDLQQLELVNAIRASLLELPETYRELLLGKYVDRLSVFELSSRYGKTEKAVEGLLARARSELRSLLDWYFLSDGADS